jgi:ubiquinone/menaquinone biosynthesis C-methylase UbiE
MTQLPSKVYMPTTNYDSESVKKNWSNGLKNPAYSIDIMPIRYIGDIVQRQPAILDLKNRLKPTSIILDGGCGQGYISEGLAFYGFEVIGLDPDVNMLNQANKRLESLSSKLKGGVKYFKGDLKQIPFQNNAFDAAIECGVTMFQSQKDLLQNLKEYFRVLKANGILSLNTYHDFLVSDASPALTSLNNPSAAKVSDLVFTDEETLETPQGSFKSTKFDEFYYHSVVSPEEIRNQEPFSIYIHSSQLIVYLAIKAGFEIVEITDLYVQKDHLQLSQNWEGGVAGYPMFRRFALRKP